MRAKEVMSTEILSVGPAHSIRHAARIMLENDVSGLPVIDGNDNLVGIVTEGDLMKRCELGTVFQLGGTAGEASQATKDFVKGNAWFVKDVMTTTVTTVSEEASLSEVAAVLVTHGIKRVPVLRDGRMIGLISRHDLLRAIAAAPVGEAITGDDRIRISVMARLREAEALVGPLPEVRVQNGCIRIFGQVRSEDARNTIRIIAEGVHGASGTEDHMVLSRPS